MATTDQADAKASLLTISEAAVMLTCKKCSGVPLSGGMMQCKDGHLMCEDCYQESDVCSVCQVKFDKATPIKSPDIVVALIDTILLQCPFKGQGCLEADMPRSQLREHLERKSEFRTANSEVTGAAGTSAGASGARRDGPGTSGVSRKRGREKSTEKSAKDAGLDSRRRSIKKKEKKDSKLPCPICGTMSTDKWKIARHIARNHHEGKNGNAGLPGLFCPFCEAKRDKAEDLMKHISHSHGDKLVLLRSSVYDSQ